MKKNNYNKTQHSVCRLTYHLVLVKKYRKDVITDEVANTIKNTIERFYKNYNLSIIEYNYEEDHLHYEIPIQKYKKALYGDAFWSRGYYIATTGDISTKIIEEYIKNQGK